MKHHYVTLALGFLLLIIPFLGLPHSFDYTIVALVGLFFLVRSALAIRRKYGEQADAMDVLHSSAPSTEQTPAEIDSHTVSGL